MITVDTVNRYLEDNGLPPDKGYLLKDAGEGAFIAEWNIGIPKPSTEQLNVYEAALLDEKPLRELKAQMENTDLSNDLENIIDALDVSTRTRISAETLDKYNAKKSLRLLKP